MTARRLMTLTPELVARVCRDVEDAGRDPALAYHTDDDYHAVVQALLASHPGGPDTWLFAYGSLIWRPEVEHLESRKGTARGWHRSFCFKIVRFRGTQEQPGLMMSLDRGGQCQGVLFRLSPQDLEAQFAKLVRREMTVKPPNNLPRWIGVDTLEGSVSAVAFVMNRRSRFYTGRLPPEEVADVISRACGHWGSCAEYLHNTVAHLEEQGIHDRHLWRLQELVAERIERAGLCS